MAFAAALWASVAAAQAPPNAATPNVTAPPQALPGVVPDAEPPPAETAPVNRSVEVNALGSPDGPPVGLLDSSNGGLGNDIWSGSRRGLIEDMLARLPLASPVRSVRMLARRLVLTTADAPVGQAPHAFQTLRIEALLAAGLIEDAAHLAAQIELKDDPEFARMQAEAILLGGSVADACGNATAARTTNTDPLWMQLRAYCYAIAGQGDLLDLTRGIMKAQGSDDRAFEVLLDDVITHKAVDPGEMHDPTAVEVFLMRQVGLPVNTSLAARFGLAASVLALRDAKNPPAMRADAAAQALHTGAVSAAELAAIADAQSFTPQQFANAKTAAEGLPFFLGQALIRQAAAQVADEKEKAALVEAAFRLGRKAGLLPIAVELQENLAASIIAAPSLRPYADSIARVLLLARRPDAAERWRESLDLNNDADAPLAAALAVELNLVATDPGRAARAQGALAWLAQNVVSPQPAGGPDAPRYATLVLGFYDALGEMIPVGVQTQTLLAAPWPGRELAPIVRKQLGEMRGEPGLKGQTILTILDAVGAEGPGDLAPDAAVTLVRTLKAEGENDTARAFAIDALLLYLPQTTVPVLLKPPPTAAAVPLGIPPAKP